MTKKSGAHLHQTTSQPKSKKKRFVRVKTTLNRYNQSVDPAGLRVKVPYYDDPDWSPVREELIEAILEALGNETAAIMARRLRDAVANKQSNTAHDVIKHIDYLHNVTGDRTANSGVMPNYPFAPRHVHRNTGYRPVKIPRRDYPAWAETGVARKNMFSMDQFSYLRGKGSRLRGGPGNRHFALSDARRGKPRTKPK
jgi:hypothetical protein